VADATDFTATGPAAIGFRTGDEAGFEKGVVASGKAIGVLGIGLGDPNSSAPTAGVIGVSEVGSGVVGRWTGIPGIARQAPPGVQGESDGPGVRGLGLPGVIGEGPTGVHGLGEGPPDVDHVGVLGESDNRGAGVHGHNQSGTVPGEVPVGNGSGGPGVLGESDNGYGGVFAGKFAPIRLMHGDLLWGPPRGTLHKVGEFYIDLNGGLFYCYGQSPPRWQQLAGPTRFSQFFNGLINILLGR